MNKYKRKHLIFRLFLTSLFILGFLFFSCQDPIFYEIDQEVELLSASVRGDINGMVRLTSKYGDFLYVSNGIVYVKTALPSSTTGIRDGAWVPYTMTGVKGNVTNIVSDDEYIYILTSYWDDDKDYGDDGYQIEKSRAIYCSKGAMSASSSPWYRVPLPADCYLIHPYEIGVTDTNYTSRIFCNNARNSAGLSTSDAKAFVRLWDTKAGGWTIYDLNGYNMPTKTEGSPSSETSSAFFYNDKTYFSVQTCATVNAYSNLVYMPYIESFEDEVPIIPVGIDALSIACAGNYTMVGTTDGAKRLHYNGTVLEKIGFTSNADSILTEHYRVPVVFALTPGAQSDELTDMYAAMTFNGTSGSTKLKHICLWAYYPTRHKWNRD